MKTLHLFIFAFLMYAFSNFLPLNAHEKGCHCLSEKQYSCFLGQMGDKIYVNPEAIVIYNDRIYLNVDSSPMSIAGLFSDENGIYISRKRQGETSWTCPVCGWENPPSTPICLNLRNHGLYEPEFQ